MKSLTTLFSVVLCFLFLSQTLRAGEFEPEELYAEKVQKHPDSEQALYAYASFLFHHKRYVESKKLLDRLLKLRPSNELGRELKGKVDEALKSGPGEVLVAQPKISNRPKEQEPCDQKKLTPLICAIKAKQFALAKKLIAQGADVQAVDFEKRSALSHAVQTSDSEIVKELLKKGADPAEFDAKGIAPLNYAIYWYAFNLEARNPTIIETLVAHPKVNINGPCQVSGELPLQTAAWAGSEAAVELLIKLGADKTKVNADYVKSERIKDLLK